MIICIWCKKGLRKMQNKNELIKGLIYLAIIIIGSTLIIRYMSGGETLDEFANKNEIPIHSVSENIE